MSNLSPEQIALEKELNNILKERLQIETALNGTQSNQANIQSVTNSMIDQNTSATKKNLDSQQSNLDSMIKAGDQLEDNASKQGLANKAASTYNKIIATTSRLYESVLKPAVKYFNQFVRLDFVYNALAQSAAEFSAQMREAAEAQQASIDAFGSMSDETQKRFREFRDNAKGLADTGRSLGSIFGAGYSDSFKALTEVYKAFGNEAQALNEKIQATAGQLVLLKESLGISYEAQKKLLQITHDVEGGYEDLTKTLVAGSKTFGVNIKDVGKAFNDIALDIKNFGYMTKKEMADTSVYVARLGLEVQELTSFAAGFDTFEGAAEKVSKLSAAFGIQLDTMDLVMEDNPAKKLDMVREALERSGRSIKDIAGNRREMNYLAETIGLPIEKITEMAEMSVDEFGFAKIAEESEKANKKMSKQDALNEIAKSMRTNLDLMKDLASGGFFANMIKGFRDMFQYTAAFREAMSRISTALYKFYNLGKAVAKQVSDLFFLEGKKEAPLEKVFEAFVGYFETVGEAADKLKGSLGDIFGYIGGFLTDDKILPDDIGKKVFDKIFDPLLSAFTDPTASQGFLNKDIRNGFVKIFALLFEVASELVSKSGRIMIDFVEGLFDNNQKDIESAFIKPANLDKFKKAFMKFGGELWKFLKTFWKAGEGVWTFMFGGKWGDKTQKAEDSLLGGMWINVKKWFKGAEAGRMASNIMNAFVGFFQTAFGFGAKAVSPAGKALQLGMSKIWAVLKGSIKIGMMGLWNALLDGVGSIGKKLMASGAVGVAIGLLFPPLAPLGAGAAGAGAAASALSLMKFNIAEEKIIIKKQLDAKFKVMDEVAKETIKQREKEGKGITPEDAIVAAAENVQRKIGGNADITTSLASIENLITVINEKITSVRKNLETLPIAKLTAAIGQGTGTELKASVPEKVVVSTDKIQIRMSLNVSMNAQDIATSLAGNNGEYYFTVNEKGALANDEVSIVDQ